MCFFTATSSGARTKTDKRPEVLCSNPKIILMVVLFPEPLGPNKPKISPWRISNAMLSTARTLRTSPKSRKTLVNPEASTMVRWRSWIPFSRSTPVRGFRFSEKCSDWTNHAAAAVRGPEAASWRPPSTTDCRGRCHRSSERPPAHSAACDGEVLGRHRCRQDEAEIPNSGTCTTSTSCVDMTFAKTSDHMRLATKPRCSRQAGRRPSCRRASWPKVTSTREAYACHLQRRGHLAGDVVGLQSGVGSHLFGSNITPSGRLLATH